MLRNKSKEVFRKYLENKGRAGSNMYTLHSTLEHTDFAQARPSGGVATLDSYVFLRRTALYLLSLLTFRPLFTLTTVRSRVWDVTVIPWKFTTTNRMRFKLWVVVGAAQIGRKSVGGVGYALIWNAV